MPATQPCMQDSMMPSTLHFFFTTHREPRVLLVNWVDFCAAFAFYPMKREYLISAGVFAHWRVSPACSAAGCASTNSPNAAQHDSLGSPEFREAMRRSPIAWSGLHEPAWYPLSMTTSLLQWALITMLRNVSSLWISDVQRHDDDSKLICFSAWKWSLRLQPW